MKVDTFKTIMLGKPVRHNTSDEDKHEEREARYPSGWRPSTPNREVLGSYYGRHCVMERDTSSPQKTEKLVWDDKNNTINQINTRCATYLGSRILVFLSSTLH